MVKWLSVFSTIRKQLKCPDHDEQGFEKKSMEALSLTFRDGFFYNHVPLTSREAFFLSFFFKYTTEFRLWTRPGG